MGENKQNQSRHKWRPARFPQRSARGLEEMSVRNSRRTRWLTCAAAKTPVDMRVNRLIIGRDRSLEQRSHEKDAPARAFVFVLESEIGWTCLQAEPAMDARVDSRQRRFEGRTGQCACGRRIGSNRGIILHNQRSAHVTSVLRSESARPSSPGLRISIGSNALLSR